MNLKKDALMWLRNTGRLPSAEINDYLSEIMELKELKAKYRALEKSFEERIPHSVSE